MGLRIIIWSGITDTICVSLQIYPIQFEDNFIEATINPYIKNLDPKSVSPNKILTKCRKVGFAFTAFRKIGVFMSSIFVYICLSNFANNTKTEIGLQLCNLKPCFFCLFVCLFDLILYIQFNNFFSYVVTFL